MKKRENITYSMHGRIIQSNRKIKIRGKKIIFFEYVIHISRLFRNFASSIACATQTSGARR